MHVSLASSPLASTGRTLAAVGLFSGLVNVLMLTGPLFMLQIYDRVLPSGSVSTLLSLFALVIALYAFMGALDLVRLRILSRMGHRLEEEAGRSAFATQIVAGRALSPADQRDQPVRDLDQLRQFASSAGAVALFDMPWLPFYVAVVYLIHPWLGHLAAAGAVALFLVAVATDTTARGPVTRGTALSTRRTTLLAAASRNADVLTGMGMTAALAKRYDDVNRDFLTESCGAADVVAASGVVSKVLRLFLQSAVLALGATLAIEGAISAGAMIAASIIMARGLQPVEMAVQNWRQLISARAAWRRLRQHLGAPAPVRPVLPPPPSKTLSVASLAVVPPGADGATLSGVGFSVSGGTGVGVIGPSGSGKSTLARALVGVWPAAEGEITLDGAPLAGRDREAFGRHVGYLPQDVELFDGTVAENIARFREDASQEDIVAAAKAAGCHEMIGGLPAGYATTIGENGARLSAGQRQRVALARALFGEPFLVVLDEPNAHLDPDGDHALNQAIAAARRRGAVVIVVAHRPAALAATNMLVVLEAGRLKAFGERDAVLKSVLRPDGRDGAKPAPHVRIIRQERA